MHHEGGVLGEHLDGAGIGSIQKFLIGLLHRIPFIAELQQRVAVFGVVRFIENEGSGVTEICEAKPATQRSHGQRADPRQ